MPTYEYKCSQCGHLFEEFQSISAAALVRCPHCGQDGLKRVMGGGAGMIFKGQGFYLTDYRKGSGESPAKKSSGESTDDKSGGKPSGGSGAAKSGGSDKES